MKVSGIIFLLSLLLIYRFWFSFSGTFSSGDWPYLFVENIREFSFFPEIRFLWLAPYYQSLTKILVQFFGIPWEAVERFFWFYPFLILSVASSYYLTRSWIGVLIYTTNTYVLMLVSGGQMGIAMAYSIAPFVIKKFMNAINAYSSLSQNYKFQITNFKLPIILGLLLSILTMFDPRVSYILAIAIAMYALLNFKKFKNVNFVLYIFVIPSVITVILNSYWIIPVLQGNIPQEFKGLGSVAGFEFLSFSDFSHAFSLLHPNWPENIFGKTSFLKPEFLLLPLFAFGSLLFINKEQKAKQKILYFALLGLLGAFLAKGLNEPFGQVNQFLFQFVPGMSMFRDPTKFYVLIALSYSVLIPFSLDAIQGRIKSKIVYLLLTIYYLLLIQPALAGKLSGTFQTHEVPKQYVQLKDFLNSQEEPFQTLWIPQKQRFGFSSKNHPAVSADIQYRATSATNIALEITKEDNLVKLKEQNIRYIIVPFDSQKELFIDDRRYSERLREDTIKQLDASSAFSKSNSFSPLILYTIK